MSIVEALSLAHDLAQHGLPCFPIGVSWNERKGKTDKRPLNAHGHNDATTDPDKLRGAFNSVTLRPGEEIGVGWFPGGAGRFALDTDIRPDVDGRATLAALEAEHGALPDHPIVKSASGGDHHIFRKPEGVAIAEGVDQLGPAIDVKGDRGWLVAPGTRTSWGSWELDEVTRGAAPLAPQWLLERVSTNGANALLMRGRPAGTRWSEVDRTKLHPADLAALEALEAVGGHTEHLGPAGEVRIVRPGKVAGPGASIGYSSPGEVLMWSTDWEIPGTNVRFLGDGHHYDADRLCQIAEAAKRGDPYMVDRLVRPLVVRSTNIGNGQAPVPTLRLVAASTIRPDRPRWTWERRIPIGGTTLMAGREGMGKTALVCWLAGKLTRGDLPGEWEGQPVDVVYIGHEDDRSTVLVPRLEAVGADRDRFHFVDTEDYTFTVATDVDELGASLRGRPVGLLVVDPLDAHLGTTIDSHKKAEVQATIGNLARLAQELRCGVLGLGHLNKAPIADLLAKVIGSVGFTTSVRSVLAIGEHPDNEGEKVCVVAKANMTDRAAVPALRFRVENAIVNRSDDGFPIDTGRVHILGEQSGLNPNTLLASSSEDRSDRQMATDFLKRKLSEGGHLSKDLMEEAREVHDISEKTLRRAGKDLNVEAYQKDRKWWWKLPSDAQMANIEEWPSEAFKDARELFAGACAVCSGPHHETVTHRCKCAGCLANPGQLPPRNPDKEF